MTDYKPLLDRIEDSIKNAQTVYGQATLPRAKVKPQPPGPHTKWGEGDTWVDDALLGVEELRVEVERLTFDLDVQTKVAASHLEHARRLNEELRRTSPFAPF